MCLAIDDVDRRTLAKGEYLGFEWQVVHNDMGVRCGYVRLLPDHPWFGKQDELDVSVHGGLTFGRHGMACATHGEEAEWWIGFDCGHAWDLRDYSLPTAPDFPIETMRKLDQSLSTIPGARVRSQEYVESECRSLAEQAAAAARV